MSQRKSIAKRRPSPLPSGATEGPRVSLERILGNTVVRSAGITANPSTGEVAYVAGCVLVVYNPRTGRQARFLCASPAYLASLPPAALSGAQIPFGDATPLPQPKQPPPRPLSCTAFGPNGRHVAAGESGRSPSVHVWDCTTGQLTMSLKGGHTNGVSCIAFSPNQRLLASIGAQGDCLNLWDVRSGTILAQGRTGALVHAVSFSEDGTFFVTAGHRHLKYWAVDQQVLAGALPTAVQAQGKPAALEGKSVALGGHRESTFVDVCCGRGSSKGCVHAVTASGTLYGFNAGRQMEKWVDLRGKVFGLTSSEKYVGCACADGNVRLFHPTSLSYVMTLPKPHPVGRNVTPDQQPQQKPAAASATSVFPDAVACKLLTGDTKIACCYSDRSFYVWSIEASAKIVKYRSFLSHSGPVMDVAVAPDTRASSLKPIAIGQGQQQQQQQGGNEDAGLLAPGSFATASSDGTLRMWNIDGLGPKNALSKDMTHLLHVIDTPSAARPPADFDKRDFAQALRVSAAVGPSSDTGICCVAFRPDGRHIALGDKQGNLRVVDVRTAEVVFEVPAHAAEILSMDYSRPGPEDDQYLLATASTDRLVHIFDAGKRGHVYPTGVPYANLHTISEHTTSVTAVRFSCGYKRLVTCTMDNDVIFWNIELQPSFTVRRYQTTSVPPAVDPAFPDDGDSAQQPPRATSPSLAPSPQQQLNPSKVLYGLALDPTERYVVTGQDRKLSLLSTSSGRISRNYKTEGAGALLRVEVDPSGLHAVTCSADKSLRLYDFYTGSLLARFGGHSEHVTCVKFTPDCRRIISGSTDGCLFVWALDADSTKAMLDRIQENVTSVAATPRGITPTTVGLVLPSTAAGQPPSVSPKTPPTSPHIASSEDPSEQQQPRPRHDESVYVLQASDTNLPSWAKDHKRQDASKSRQSSARGVWAHRVVDPSVLAPPSPSAGPALVPVGDDLQFVNLADPIPPKQLQPADERESRSAPKADEQAANIEEEDISEGEVAAPLVEPQKEFHVTTKAEGDGEDDAADVPQSARGSCGCNPPSAPLMSPKVAPPQDPIDDDDKVLQSALVSLASPKIDMLRQSLSSDFLNAGAPPRKLSPALEPPHRTPMAAVSSALINSSGNVKLTFLAEAASVPGIPTTSPISELMRPPSLHASPPSPSGQQPPPQQQAKSPPFSPLDGTGKRGSPKDLATSGHKIPLEPISSLGAASDAMSDGPPPEERAPTVASVVAGLRVAIADSASLLRAAQEQSQREIEDELRVALTAVHREIGAIIGVPTADAVATIDAAFERYTEQLMVKIGHHVELTVEAALNARQDTHETLMATAEDHGQQISSPQQQPATQPQQQPPQ